MVSSSVHCLICDQELALFSQAFCEPCLLSCMSEQQGHKYSCNRCARPLAQQSQYCGQCAQSPPVWARMEVCGDYSQVLSYLIREFKYQKKLFIADALSRLLAERIRLSGADIPDAIIPMPLHWTRTWSRGFNQSALLSRNLSKITGIPVDEKLAKRVRRTPPLETFDRKSREKTMDGVFQVRGKVLPHLAIVDDVFTTGASTGSLCRALQAAGAERIDLWVLARTPLGQC